MRTPPTNTKIHKNRLNHVTDPRMTSRFLSPGHTNAQSVPHNTHQIFQSQTYITFSMTIHAGAHQLHE